MEPIVSIIVPIYNIEEKLLRRGVESILCQTLTEIEVLLIDDGSPDNAGDICDEYASKDYRIHVFHNENSGVSVARNCGIEHSTGKYLMFVDPDDYIDAETCGKCVAAMEEISTDILFFGYAYKEDEIQRSGEIHCSDYTERMKMEQSIISQQQIRAGFLLGSPWGKLFSGDYVRENLRFIPGLKRSQDRVFMLYAIENACSVAWYDITGYYYELSETSCGKKYNPNIRKILEAAGDEIEGFVDKYHKNDETYKKALNKMWLVLAFEYFQLYYFNSKFDGNVAKSAKELFSADPYKTALKETDLIGFRRQIRLIFGLFKVNLYSIGSLVGKRIYK